MEKNKQILDFGDIINEVYDGYVLPYNRLRSLFLDYIEYIGMSWDNYIKMKTRKEIINEFKYFDLYHYLPF